MSEPIKIRIATAIQMALGLTLLLLAVSTDFDFVEPSAVTVMFLDNARAQFLIPAIVVIAIKAFVAFLGSYLLIRRTLVLNPPAP